MAQKLATQTGAAYLRIDTIEQSLRDFCAWQVEGEGYELAYRLAQDNLRLGLSVVADSCNSIALTRHAWESVAKQSDARFENIQIVCADAAEHRTRIETRRSTIPNLKLPSWQDVVQRDYQPWNSSCIVIDTAGKTVAESFRSLCQKLAIALDHVSFG